MYTLAARFKHGLLMNRFPECETSSSARARTSEWRQREATERHNPHAQWLAGARTQRSAPPNSALSCFLREFATAIGWARDQIKPR
ncbi:MAG: hypothetical protein QOJ41_2577 [Acidobacteriaceae bacterium]|nr:hypothetical protein [Acidobacteriaceae bacterium]